MELEQGLEFTSRKQGCGPIKVTVGGDCALSVRGHTLMSELETHVPVCTSGITETRSDDVSRAVTIAGNIILFFFGNHIKIVQCYSSTSHP